MTKRSTFTQAQVRRIIKAALREGLRVTGIKPDGTVIVHEQEPQQIESLDQEREAVL
jgi:hypothetical protein